MIASRPRRSHSYDEAIARIQAIQAQERRGAVRDVCITRLLTHAKQTEHVIVLIHGFTNCPEQFSALGKHYYEAGKNVLIPCMPYHGSADRLTPALANLTAENLAAFGDTVIDIARGLAQRVTVVGISGSGTLVSWLAQNRADMDFAVAIAPLFGLFFIPSPFTKLFVRVALLMPNLFLWWDPRTKEKNPYSAAYAYPRYPTRALAEILRLAIITRDQAAHTPPRAGSLTMIINDAEPAVSNAEIARLIRLWRQQGASNVHEVHFEKELRLPHDIITPGTPGVPVAEVQRRLAGVIHRAHADDLQAEG